MFALVGLLVAAHQVSVSPTGALSGRFRRARNDTNASRPKIRIGLDSESLPGRPQIREANASVTDALKPTIRWVDGLNSSGPQSLAEQTSSNPPDNHGAGHVVLENAKFKALHTAPSSEALNAQTARQNETFLRKAEALIDNSKFADELHLSEAKFEEHVLHFKNIPLGKGSSWNVGLSRAKEMASMVKSKANVQKIGFWVNELIYDAPRLHTNNQTEGGTQMDSQTEKELEHLIGLAKVKWQSQSQYSFLKEAVDNEIWTEAWHKAEKANRDKFAVDKWIDDRVRTTDGKTKCPKKFTTEMKVAFAVEVGPEMIQKLEDSLTGNTKDACYGADGENAGENATKGFSVIYIDDLLTSVYYKDVLRRLSEQFKYFTENIPNNKEDKLEQDLAFVEKFAAAWELTKKRIEEVFVLFKAMSERHTHAQRCKYFAHLKLLLFGEDPTRLDGSSKYTEIMIDYADELQNLFDQVKPHIDLLQKVEQLLQPKQTREKTGHKSKVDTARSEKTKAQTDLDQQSRLIGNLQDQLDAVKGNKKAKEEEKTELAGRHKAASETSSAAQKAFSSKKGEESGATRARDQEKQKAERKKKDAESAFDKTKQQAERQQREAIEAAEAAHAKTDKEQNAKKDAALTVIKEKNEEIAAAERIIAQSGPKLDAATKEAKTTAKEAIEGADTAKNDKIEEAKRDLEEKEQALKTIQNALPPAEAAQKSAAKEVERLTKLMKTLDSAINEFQKQIPDKETKLAEAKKQLGTFETTLTSKSTAYDDLEKQHNDLTALHSQQTEKVQKQVYDIQEMLAKWESKHSTLGIPKDRKKPRSPSAVTNERTPKPFRSNGGPGAPQTAAGDIRLGTSTPYTPKRP